MTIYLNFLLRAVSIFLALVAAFCLGALGGSESERRTARYVGAAVEDENGFRYLDALQQKRIEDSVNSRIR